MFPAAVGIVVASFPLRESGRAMAIFFGISGGSVENVVLGLKSIVFIPLFLLREHLRAGLARRERRQRAGAGVGLMLGTASTDAVNRAPSTSYSEVTGITQTARNFGASLGLAILGAILVSQDKIALTKAGVPRAAAERRVRASRLAGRWGNLWSFAHTEWLEG